MVIGNDCTGKYNDDTNGLGSTFIPLKIRIFLPYIPYFSIELDTYETIKVLVDHVILNIDNFKWPAKLQTSINKDTKKVTAKGTIYCSLILHQTDTTYTKRKIFSIMNHKVPR